MVRTSRLIGFILILAAHPAFADNYTETTKWWFINTLNPNWTCADNSEPCYPTGPNYSAFVGVYMIRYAGTLYAYVQGGGNPGPCATTAGGDNFCVFTAPDTAPGWTGQGLSLVNQRPRPDDGRFWQLSSGFYDTNTFNEFVLLAGRYDGASFSTITESDLELGRSTDGIHFNWSVLLTSNPAQVGFWVTNFALVPHPTTPKLWVGMLNFVASNGEGFTTFCKIDWNASLIWLQDSTGTWRSIPVGGTLTFSPYTSQFGGVSNIQAVTLGTTTRLEAWQSGVVSGQGSGIQNNPCAPGYPNGVATSQYLTNRSNPQQAGSSAAMFRVFDPNALAWAPGSSWTEISSQVRGLPSDYVQALGYDAFRSNMPGRYYLYTGSKDNVICISPLRWSPWAGDGILVTKMNYTP
jgi:hypothetical protein